MKKLFCALTLLLLNHTSDVSAQPVQLKTADRTNPIVCQLIGDTPYYAVKDTLFKFDPVLKTETILHIHGEAITNIFPEKLNGNIFYATQDSTGLQSIWKTDEVSFVNLGETGFAVAPLVVFNEEYYFQSGDTRLWKIDADLNTLTVVSSTFNDNMFIVSNGFLYFQAATGSPFNLNIWRTDGTSGGTAEAVDVPFTDYFFIGEVAGTIYFFRGGSDSTDTPITQLWKTNGTNAGTVLVRDFAKAGASSSIGNAVTYKGALYFLFTEQNKTTGYHSVWLARTNPSVSGIQLVTFLGTSLGVYGKLSLVNELLAFFRNSDPNVYYRSDGTNNGTAAFYSTDLSITSETEAGNYLFFKTFADHEVSEPEFELFQSDLTSDNTKSLKEMFNAGPYYGHEVIVSGTHSILFKSYDKNNPDVEFLYYYDPLRPSEDVPYFTVVDADKDEDLQWLKEGDVLYLARTSDINIRYNPAGEPGSVVFEMNHPGGRIENEAPFALAGDHQGNYNSWTRAAAGDYTLTATPYSHNGGTGLEGPSLTVNFVIKNGISSATPLRKINISAGNTPMTDDLAGFTARPNPSRDIFRICISGSKAGEANLEIFRTDGELVEVLFSRHVDENETVDVFWNASEMEDGIYFCRYSTLDQVKVKRIVLVK